MSLDEKKYPSRKAEQFTESVIREMSRVAAEYGAVNLAQGFPDFPAPLAVKEAAVEAVMGDLNQYAVTWGIRELREGIAEKMQRDYGIVLDPEKQITVCCGSTEGMMATLLAVVNPGDEVIIFEPFYENYGADVILCGAVPRYVSLRPPYYTIDFDELSAVFSEKTRAIIINTPHNPTGKVFSRAELEVIAALCIRHDVLAITDEIYEHIIYDGEEHVPLWTLPGMEDRTVIVNGISKTYSVTGWRIGYVMAPPRITAAVRKVHDFLTVGAAAPLQWAAAKALALPLSYYEELRQGYRQRRDFLHNLLKLIGFSCIRPQGAYYIMADIRSLGWENDVDFTFYLAKEIQVAAVPGSSFCRKDDPTGKYYVRFCFAKKLETLAEAGKRLERLVKAPVSV